jgi:2-oxoglutarate ferredoxin oxidoreductase subunit delta
VAKGEIKIKEDLCLGCGYCVEFCPQKCIAISSQTNPSGVLLPKFVAPEKCTGCGICGRMCPQYVIDVYRKVDARPEKAETKI